MLDIKFIRENLELVKKAAKDKGYEIDIDKLLVLDDKRKKLLKKLEENRFKQNEISKKGKPSEAEINKSKIIKAEIADIEKKVKAGEQEYLDLFLRVPNIVSKKSPKGDEKANKIIKKVGNTPKFDFPILDHVQLGEKHNLLDMERAVKIGGTRSYILKNELEVLEHSLIRYAIDVVRKEGFQIMNVPVLVKKDVLIGSGFFPFQEEDVYQVNEEDQFLVGTSEASLVYYHSGEILAENELPKLLSGVTTCFRKEVGTYGKDNRGIFRVHQFNKVEQVVLCKEEDSEKMFNFILGISEQILESLGLAYRIVEIATGDMGAKNFRQNDLEVWFPAQDKYRETHSCSYLTDFQARRANIKYRDDKGVKNYVHTLNNTGIATPRILGAILETHQQKDGSIKIPEVLQKYTSFKEIK
jgi:seryl-tRNA synthetase